MVMKWRHRAAAWTGAAILAVIAALQFYWGLGGTWRLDEASVAAASSTAADIGSVIIGLVALAGACVLLVRVGYWRGHVPLASMWMTRTLGFVALGGAVAQFAEQGFAAGTIDLIVGVLAFTVARSDLPPSPTARAAPTTKPSPGPPARTH